MWQGFDSRRAAEVASVRRHQNPSLCRTEHVVVCPKTAPPQVRAERFGNVSSTSVVTYLGKSKEHCTTAAEREK